MDWQNSSLPVAFEYLEESCCLNIRGILGYQPAQDYPAVRLKLKGQLKENGVFFRL
jgi:hypothetical protein